MLRHLATSLNYKDDVTFCLDESYCCGSNNTACCTSNSGDLEIFYRNPNTIPSATASLPGYYSNLQVSTKSRSTTISSSPSSIQTSATASNSTSPTASTTPTSSTLNASPTSASHNKNVHGGLSEDAKIAIGVVIPVVVIVAAFVTWWFLGQRRSHKTAGPQDEKVKRHHAGLYVPDLSRPSELQTGLDRAELVTRQWDSAELPANHGLVELAGRP